MGQHRAAHRGDPRGRAGELVHIPGRLQPHRLRRRVWQAQGKEDGRGQVSQAAAGRPGRRRRGRGRGGDGIFLDPAAEEYIKGRERYLYENSFASVEELRKRHAFVKEFCHLEPLFAPPGDTIVDQLEELGRELEMVQGMADEAGYWLERTEKAIETTEAQNRVLQQDLEIARLVSELARLLRV